MISVLLLLKEDLRKHVRAGVSRRLQSLKALLKMRQLHAPDHGHSLQVYGPTCDFLMIKLIFNHINRLELLQLRLVCRVRGGRETQVRGATLSAYLGWRYARARSLSLFFNLILTSLFYYLASLCCYNLQYSAWTERTEQNEALMAIQRV